MVPTPTNDNADRLKLPEPFHTTLGPTCETVTLKLPVTPDVGVGVGVADVAVGVGVGATGVPVGVGVVAGVPVGVGVTGPCDGVGVGVIKVNDVQYPFAVNQAVACDVVVNGGNPILGGIELHKSKKDWSVSTELLQNPK